MEVKAPPKGSTSHPTKIVSSNEFDENGSLENGKVFGKASCLLFLVM
jgi:hypothetical protein